MKKKLVKIAKIVVRVVGVFILLYAIGWCVVLWNFRFNQLKTATEFTPSQISELQNEYGFVLPEEATIVMCKISTNRDRLFYTAISGVPDVDEFINNLEFAVKDPSHTTWIPYNTTQLEEYVKADCYGGEYNGSKRRVYVYYIGSEMIVELEKRGVHSKELSKMF